MRAERSLLRDSDRSWRAPLLGLGEALGIGDALGLGEVLFGGEVRDGESRGGEPRGGDLLGGELLGGDARGGRGGGVSIKDHRWPIACNPKERGDWVVVNVMIYL